MGANIQSDAVVSFYRFTRLLGVGLFSVLRSDEREIAALVAWADDCEEGAPGPEDIQEVRWQVGEVSNLADALTLGELALDSGWIATDRIDASADLLQRESGWDNDRFQRALDTLLSVRVQMVDNGQPTDVLLLHM